MGFCSKRHFLLTICTLQLITTIERQVFDFLGFMWLPILFNFFNIIFIILGFFGAFQYRPKYLITYCLWDVLWLGWNIFLICFYLEVGGLNKMSDILNFGTGSFSWWQENGPGCNAAYDVTEPGFLVRPTNVTNCVLNYEVIEIIHASTQCILVLMAIIGGIFLTRAFMEEDDSFDFVGGGDFGLAGHTPLHPMYVSYSALPPNQNYQSYPRVGTTGSNNSSLYYRDNNNSSSNTTLPKIIEKTILNYSNNNNNNNNINNNNTNSNQRVKLSPMSFVGNDTTKSNKSNNSSIKINSNNIDYYNDYSNPVDHLHRPISPSEYDSLENNNNAQLRLYDRNNHDNSSSRYYSPVVSPVMRRARTSQAPRQNRNSYRPRIYTDFIREQPLRSYHSDPRLAMEQQQQQQQQQSQQPQQQQQQHQRQISTDNDKRNSRPISLYAS